jgi:hypothetical protein
VLPLLHVMEMAGVLLLLCICQGYTGAVARLPIFIYNVSSSETFG